MTEQRRPPTDQDPDPQLVGSPDEDELLEDLEPEDGEVSDEVHGGRGGGAGKANFL
jgi:hypothetical protein